MSEHTYQRTYLWDNFYQTTQLNRRYFFLLVGCQIIRSDIWMGVVHRGVVIGMAETTWAWVENLFGRRRRRVNDFGLDLFFDANVCEEEEDEESPLLITFRIENRAWFDLFSKHLLRTFAEDDLPTYYRLTSVTRFGEIAPLWQNFTSLWQIFDTLFLIWQNVEPTLVH